MTAKFLNEAFDASMGTQRAAMGDYKENSALVKRGR